MQIYHVETQEDYDALMVELENEGFLWSSGRLPTSKINRRDMNRENSCIVVRDTISYASKSWCEHNYPDIPIEKYKVKTLKWSSSEEAGKKISVSIRKFNKALRQSEKEVNDPVNNPSHYTQGELEVIDILQDKLTPQEFEGFLKGNILKYTFREGIKNGTEDMKKGAWYMARLIDFRGDK